MKKVFSVLAGVTVLLAMLVVPLVGCGGEVSFTTASLSEATMATGVDEGMEPLGATDVFATDIPEVFCSVKLSNAPDETELSAEWIYVKGEVADLENYLIDSYALTTDGTRYLSFSLTQPDAGWPRGDYQVVLYVDGKEQLTVPFAIQ